MRPVTAYTSALAFDQVAVFELRHWIGESSDNELALYRFLTRRAKFSRSSAGAVLKVHEDVLRVRERKVLEGV